MMMSEIEDEVMVKPISRSIRCKESPSSVNTDTGLDFTLSQMIHATPDVDKARVEFIKKEISSGRYKISNNLIAEKMLME